MVDCHSLAINSGTDFHTAKGSDEWNSIDGNSCSILNLFFFSPFFKYFFLQMLDICTDPARYTNSFGMQLVKVYAHVESCSIKEVKKSREIRKNEEFKGRMGSPQLIKVKEFQKEAHVQRHYD